MEERLYWLGFSMFPGIGTARFHQLLAKFKTAERAWNATTNRLIEAGISGTLVAEFDLFRNTHTPEQLAKDVKQKNVEFVTLAQSNYPEGLKKLSRPPFVLYIVGNREILNQVQDDKTFAVVGTRTITTYGQEVTRMFTQGLVANGFVIVSGLALGVDAAAHQATLDVGGKTIAVLGCGVDCPNPRENSQLYADIIAKGGLIVSEIPPSTNPTRGSFIARNRIIAGLSLGVLVTEGAEDSGALTTAEFAQKMNRPVFAVPGPITSSLSKGPYKLISKGGKLVTGVEDILKELRIVNQLKTRDKGDTRDKRDRGGTKEEEEILKILENESLHFDEIVKKTKLSSSIVATTLSFMEIKGIVKNNDSVFSIIL